MVGSANQEPHYELDFPKSDHVHGALRTDEQASRDLGKDRLLHSRSAKWQPDAQPHPSVCALVRLNTSDPARSIRDRKHDGRVGQNTQPGWLGARRSERSSRSGALC